MSLLTTKVGFSLKQIAQNFIRSRSTIVENLIPEISSRPSKGRAKLFDLIKEKYGVASNSTWAKTLRDLRDYWKLEMAPPNPKELGNIKKDIALMRDFLRSGAWKTLTVKQAWLLFLVGLEVCLWFYLGETVGKGSFVGYKV